MDFSNTTRESNSYRNHGYTDEVDDDNISDHSNIDMTDIRPDVKDGKRQTQQINGNVSREIPEVQRRKSSKK